MSILLLILGLVLFVGLVVVHEFGHFIMARRGGVEVEEFGIGFPPQAKVLTKKKGTVYTLNWLPLGGFVKLKGENDADKSRGSYGAASLGTKVKIMLAGVVMNLLAAFVLLTFLALIGMPKLIDNQFTVARDTHIVKQEVLVGLVEGGSPAEKAGLKTQDQITRVAEPYLNIGCLNDCRFHTTKDLTDATHLNAGKPVSINYVRNGRNLTTETQLRTDAEVEASKKTDNPKGYLGIVPTEYVVQRSTWSAPVVAVGFMKQVTVLTFKGLGTALKGLGSTIAGVFTGNTKARQMGQAEAGSQVSGPLGIYFILKDGASSGIGFILMIIAVISLTLAIMNVLPIPALDGGRLFVALLFRAVRRPLRKKTEDLIHGTGFAALMLLFVLITVVDVKRFF